MGNSVSAVYDNRDRVTGIVAVSIDLTERRAAEARLREGEARFRALVNASSDVIYRLSADWTEMQQLDGRGFLSDNDEPSIRWMEAYLFAEDRPQVMAAIDEAVRSRRAFELEHRVRRADGTPGWTFSRAIPVCGANGEIAEWFGMAADVTERRAAEEGLRASEERYRTLFEAMDAGFCIVEVMFDAQGRPVDYRFLEVNPAFERQTGLTGAAGRTARELVSDLESVWFEIYGRVALTGKSERFENGSDAMGRWFDVYALRVGAPEQRRVAILFNDISERRKAEQALRELNNTLERRIAEALAERKMLADFVDSTDAFVQVVGLDFRWLAINRSAANEFEKIFGVRPRMGDNMLDLLADKPEHRAAVEAVWRRALAGEEFTETGEFGDPSRSRRHYEMKYNVLRRPDGERIGAYQFVYDVTKRVRAQERLREAEAARREADALYRAYFENSPEALFVIGVQPDGTFVIEEVNPAHEKGVGFKIEDMRGKRVEDVLPPALAERVLGTYRRVVETGENYQYREVFDLTGEPQHWDTSLVPVRDLEGRIVRVIGSSRNVTRQVIAEEALRQSQKMESIGQLTGGVAHDFNNLLTPIVGALDLLQRKGLGGEREQRLIAGAARSAERARTLVQRLLTFARRQPLQPTAVDVARLVTGMAELIASTTGPQIKVVVEVTDDLPPARADPNQLEMALLNLAVNARDAMPDGGTLRISRVGGDGTGRGERQASAGPLSPIVRCR